MAKLVRHLTSNEEIVSSNLAEGIPFFEKKNNSCTYTETSLVLSWLLKLWDLLIGCTGSVTCSKAGGRLCVFADD